MLNFRRILCPVDFSPTSQHAFDFAVELAARLGAEIKLLHVYQLPTYVMPDGVYEIPVGFETGLRERLQVEITKFAASKSGAGVAITTELCEGLPFIDIVRVAKEYAADLIVIGTHGRTGFSHLLMGSVAERVVRTSDIPVISLRKP